MECAAPLDRKSEWERASVQRRNSITNYREKEDEKKKEKKRKYTINDGIAKQITNVLKFLTYELSVSLRFSSSRWCDFPSIAINLKWKKTSFSCWETQQWDRCASVAVFMCTGTRACVYSCVYVCIDTQLYMNEFSSRNRFVPTVIIVHSPIFSRIYRLSLCCFNYILCSVVRELTHSDFEAIRKVHRMVYKSLHSHWKIVLINSSHSIRKKKPR